MTITSYAAALSVATSMNTLLSEYAVDYAVWNTAVKEYYSVSFDCFFEGLITYKEREVDYATVPSSPAGLRNFVATCLRIYSTSSDEEALKNVEEMLARICREHAKALLGTPVIRKRTAEFAALLA